MQMMFEESRNSSLKYNLTNEMLEDSLKSKASMIHEKKAL